MGTPTYEAEAFYDVLRNVDDELLVTIRARSGGPADPIIYYDGKEHALLQRSEDTFVILDYLHPEVRETFFKSKNVLIAEFRETGIIREYHVPVKVVDTLPLAPEYMPKED